MPRSGVVVASATFVLLSAIGSAAGTGPGVEVWLTTADGAQRLAPQKPAHFADDRALSSLDVQVDDETAYQTIDGFGASLTDSSAALIWKLGKAERESLLRKLFDPQSGIGLSFLRQPMGASDFSTVGNYSYDDVPEGESDLELRRFSIAHDLEYIVPELKRIKTINPQLRIMANPWSPPAWMKTSGSMIGGTLLPSAYDAWAEYFVKFVRAYEEQGVPIDYLSLQNEPLNVPKGYPGMGMDAATQVDLLAKHLGPALTRAGIRAKVMGWDHNWTNSYPYEVLKNPSAYAHAAGTAWHCYGGQVDSQSELRKIFPDRDHWQTECSGFTGGTFAKDLKEIVGTMIIGVTRHWGRSSVRWNLALDEKLGPQNGGCDNCTALVTIDSQTAAVTYNVDYYALGHASKFVEPGAVRVDSNTFEGRLENVAFLNADGSRVLVVFNPTEDTQVFQVVWRGQTFRYTLADGAAVTFRWKGEKVVPHAPKPPAATTVAATVANLAAQKSVTASSFEKAGTEAGLAVDGNGLTRWSSAFSDPQWIQVDLGAPASISRVRLNWEAACGKAYQIQISNDEREWTTVADVTDGHAGVDERAVAATGRYVRVLGTARATEYGYSLYELEVYGASRGQASEVAASTADAKCPFGCPVAAKENVQTQ